MDNVIRFQKETLQEYTEHLFVFCRLVWIPKPNQSIFLREVAKNVKNWKILLFRQLCGHLRIFSKKLQMFLKTIFGYRVQFFLNCEPARKVYKKVNKNFEKGKKGVCTSFKYLQNSFFKHYEGLSKKRVFEYFKVWYHFFKVHYFVKQLPKLLLFRLVWGHF